MIGCFKISNTLIKILDVMDNLFHRYVNNFANFPTHSKTFHDSDSVQTPEMWAADFIAGAFHLVVKYNDTSYHDLLELKFIGVGSKTFDF